MDKELKIKTTYFVSFNCNDEETRNRIIGKLENAVNGIMLFEPKAEIDGTDFIHDCDYKDMIDRKY